MLPAMDHAISAGDIERATFDPTVPPLHLGSGRCGACFDAWGLQGGGGLGPPAAAGATVIEHKDHWSRDVWGKDQWLPLTRLGWDTDPGTPRAWRQRLTLGDAVLATDAEGEGWSWSVRAWFHPDQRDVLALRIRCAGGAGSQGGKLPALVLAPDVGSPPARATWRILDTGERSWSARVRCPGGADSLVALRIVGVAPASVTSDARGARIELGDGEHLLLIGCGAIARAGTIQQALAAVDPASWADSAAAAWARRWGDARLELPDPALQACWARSLFWQFCGNAPEQSAPAPPCGLTGTMWRFPFPQDLSYIHPALLRAGHADLVAGWVEHFRSHLAWQEDVTKRIYRRASDGVPAAGAMWAWEFPIGPGADMLAHGTPNWYQFEIHNAHYPARMAWDCARHRRDPAWTEAIAWPVIRASARFFASVLERGADGLWGIHVLPSSGQDEYGGNANDAPDYLCALYAARACLRTALACAEQVGDRQTEHAQWRSVLADGLAFERLRHAPTGLLVANARMTGGAAFGHQKHPIQLQPLIFSPIPARFHDRADADAVRAYEHADTLCDRGPERPRFSWGWTSPALWAAASRLGRGEDLGAMLAGPELDRLLDRGGASLRESTVPGENGYYLTNHGLFLQAVQDACVDDTFGEVRIAGALPESWRGATWRGLRTADGGSHDGTWNGAQRMRSRA